MLWWASYASAEWWAEKANFLLVCSLVAVAATTIVVISATNEKEHHWDKERKGHRDKIIEFTADGAQSPWDLHIGEDVYEVGAINAAGLGNEDLLENEFQIRPNELDHVVLPFARANSIARNAEGTASKQLDGLKPWHP